jgi:hypothetical protein
MLGPHRTRCGGPLHRPTAAASTSPSLSLGGPSGVICPAWPPTLSWTFSERGFLPAATPLCRLREESLALRTSTPGVGGQAGQITPLGPPNDKDGEVEAAAASAPCEDTPEGQSTLSCSWSPAWESARQRSPVTTGAGKTPRQGLPPHGARKPKVMNPCVGARRTWKGALSEAPPWQRTAAMPPAMDPPAQVCSLA